jgi:hypothetical protein
MWTSSKCGGALAEWAVHAGAVQESLYAGCSMEREVRRASAWGAERIALWFAVVRRRANCGPAGEPGRSERRSSTNERTVHIRRAGSRIGCGAGRGGAQHCQAPQKRERRGASQYDVGGRGTKGVRASGTDEQQGREYYWAW